jgi:hypothetical protein
MHRYRSYLPSLLATLVLMAGYAVYLAAAWLFG